MRKTRAFLISINGFDIELQGDSGQNKLMGPYNVASAIKDFGKKFSDKTKNKWESRDNFVAKAGKYTLIEMGDDDEEEEEINIQKVSVLLPSPIQNSIAI